MTHTTLRELNGLNAQPATLAQSTVILVDYQNTYTRGVMELDGWQAALDEAATLLAQARAQGAKVIHVINDGGTGTLYDIRDEIGQIHPRVAPQQGEPVIVKQVPNAFVGTTLAQEVESAAGDRRLHEPHVRHFHHRRRLFARQPAHRGGQCLRHSCAAFCGG